MPTVGKIPYREAPEFPGFDWFVARIGCTMKPYVRNTIGFHIQIDELSTQVAWLAVTEYRSNHVPIVLKLPQTVLYSGLRKR